MPKSTLFPSGCRSQALASEKTAEQLAGDGSLPPFIEPSQFSVLVDVSGHLYFCFTVCGIKSLASCPTNCFKVTCQDSK